MAGDYNGPERRRESLTNTDVLKVRDAIREELNRMSDEGQVLSRTEREDVRYLLKERQWWLLLLRAVVGGVTVAGLVWLGSKVLEAVALAVHGGGGGGSGAP